MREVLVLDHESKVVSYFKKSMSNYDVIITATTSDIVSIWKISNSSAIHPVAKCPSETNVESPKEFDEIALRESKSQDWLKNSMSKAFNFFFSVPARLLTN